MFSAEGRSFWGIKNKANDYYTEIRGEDQGLTENFLAIYDTYKRTKMSIILFILRYLIRLKQYHFAFIGTFNQQLNCCFL